MLTLFLEQDKEPDLTSEFEQKKAHYLTITRLRLKLTKRNLAIQIVGYYPFHTFFQRYRGLPAEGVEFRYIQ